MPENPAIFAMSPLQAVMLRGSLAHGEGRSSEQLEVTFAAGVTGEQIQSAWEKTVASVEVMRMGFLIEGGEPNGLVADILPATLAMVIENEWCKEDRQRPLPLDGECPWRVVHCEAGGKLLWTFHHALLDGRSAARILQVFLAYLAGAAEVPNLSHSQWVPPSASEVEAAHEYYREALTGVDRWIPEFPHAQEAAMAVCGNSLGAPLLHELTILAKTLEVTVATMVTWAWGQTLMTAAGAQTVVLGQIRAGPPLAGTAGFSINTLPLILKRDLTQPASVGLQLLRQQLLEMRQFERVSPENLPADLFHECGGPWPCGLLMVEHGTMEHQCGKHPLVKSIKLYENSGESLIACAYLEPDLRLEIEVDGIMYGENAAQALLDHWEAILIHLAQSSAQSTAEVTRLPAAMAGVLDELENGGEVLRWCDVATCWSEAAAKFPEHDALWMPDRRISYQQLAAMANALATRLEGLGVKVGTPVANLLHNRGHLAVAILGIAQAGGVHVPLDPILPSERHLAILADSKALCILTDDAASCGAFGLPWLLLDEEESTSTHLGGTADAEAVLALLYTSGSTGVPKGVIMHHGGVVDEALAIGQVMENGPGERLLQFSSAGFDASLEEVLSTLLSGGTLVPRPEEIAADLGLFHDFLESAEISMLDLTTSFWAAWSAWMVAENKTFPAKIRCTIIGGERLSEVALGHWKLATGGARLLNSYGPTEASIVATLHEIDFSDTSKRDPAIGKPLPGVLARVADSSGNSLTQGAVGELWLGGRCVSPGYWNNEELTQRSFFQRDGERWYRTGDRSHWDEEGRLRFIGRIDEQLKIRGHRVEPAEVIRLLETYPNIRAAHVAGYTVDGNAPLLAAWLCWEKTPAEDALENVAQFLQTRLPAASIPVRWAYVPEFRLTERGKLDRKALPAPLLTLSNAVAYEPPENPTETHLVRLFSELLGVERIGRNESFFSLGGHSLAALRLFSSISREWNIRLPMGTLIEAATPRLLALRIRAQLEKKDTLEIPQAVLLTIRAEGHLLPLFCIHGGDGGVVFYRNLGVKFSGDRPLLAIEAPSLGAADELAVGTVEETAAAYLQVLREHQPSGPYHLAGYSFGGLIAYEMACQFRGMGEEIAFCGLFDTVNPAIDLREYGILERAEIYWNSQKQQTRRARIVQILQRLGNGIATHWRVKHEIRVARKTRKSEPHSDVRMLKVRNAHWQAMVRYRPRSFDGKVTLFSVLAVDDKFEIPDDYGWTAMVRSLEIVRVPGEHLTMFSERNAAKLAKQIKRRIG